MNNKSWSRGKGESTSGGHVDHLLSAYIQKDLDPATRAEVLKHLQSCADCRADYIELEATRRLLKSLPTVAPPRAFTITPEMAGSHSAEKSRRTIWSRLFAPRNAPRFAFGSVVSVVLTLIVLGVGLLNSERSSSNEFAASTAPVAIEQSRSAAAQDSAMTTATPAAPGSSAVSPDNKVFAAPTTAAASGGASAGGSAAQAAGTPLAGDVPAQPPQVITGTSQAESNYGSQLGGPGGLSANSSGDHSSLSAPAPTTSSTTSASSLTGLAVSFGVLFGVLSVLLAVAALISTRRAG